MYHSHLLAYFSSVSVIDIKSGLGQKWVTKVRQSLCSTKKYLVMDEKKRIFVMGAPFKSLNKLWHLCTQSQT